MKLRQLAQRLSPWTDDFRMREHLTKATGRMDKRGQELPETRNQFRLLDGLIEKSPDAKTALLTELATAQSAFKTEIGTVKAEMTEKLKIARPDFNADGEQLTRAYKFLKNFRRAAEVALGTVLTVASGLMVGVASYNFAVAGKLFAGIFFGGSAALFIFYSYIHGRGLLVQSIGRGLTSEKKALEKRLDVISKLEQKVNADLQKIREILSPVIA